MCERTVGVLLIATLAGCPGARPPSSPEAAAPTAPAPEPTVGEGACSAAADCDGGRRVTCNGISKCTATDGLGCRAERASDPPVVVHCCDGTQSCAVGLTPAE